MKVYIVKSWATSPQTEVLATSDHEHALRVAMSAAVNSAHTVEVEEAEVGRGSVITITREQAEEWAGRPLSDEDMESLDDAVSFSSIPEAISLMVDGLRS